MKKEIEILYKLNESTESAIEKLSSIELKGIQNVIDIYYFDPLREDLKPGLGNRLSASFRLRNKNGQSILTYKTDHFDDNIWSHSDEYEIQVSDHETTKSMIRKLGFHELVVVDVKKTVFVNEDFEVVIEEVKNLGTFVEVEYHWIDDEKDVNKAKEDIRTWIRKMDINVGEEMNAGKPELLLKNKIKI